MKVTRWNQEKNEKLRIERGVTFEMVVAAIQQGDELKNLIHPNQTKYPNQRISIVRIDNYVYLVPYIENESEVFLKTIIPSRKATKQYLKGDKEQ